MLVIRQGLTSLCLIGYRYGIINCKAFFVTSAYVPSASVTKDIDSLLMKLNSNEDIISRYKEFGKKLTSTELKVLSSQILKTYVPRGDSHDEILGLVLMPFRDDVISSDLIKDTLNMVLKFSKSESFPESLQRELTRRLLRINEVNPEFLCQFISTIDGFENKENRNMLVSLYLQNKQLQKAYDLIISNIHNSEALKISSIELVIHHLCHRENIQKASTLIELSSKHGYELYSRTLSTFLTKVIQLGDAEICYKHYYFIIRRTYIDNGSLINLIELISTIGYVREVKELYKFLLNKTGFVPAEFTRRYNRSLVESLARVRGFKRAFKMLKDHPPRSLKVSDYPELSKNITVSFKLRKIEFTLLKRMNYPSMNIAFKKFYLNLIISKLAEQGNIEKGLEILKAHSKIRRYMDQETISYIIHGLSLSPSLTGLESLFELLDKFSVKLKHKRIINPLLEMIIGSEYWFKVFLVLEMIQLENYKLPIKLATTLKQKCEKFGYNQYKKYI